MSRARGEYDDFKTRLSLAHNQTLMDAGLPRWAWIAEFMPHEAKLHMKRGGG
jgi:hypothetical protein